jgi:hypothetical protein
MFGVRKKIKDPFWYGIYEGSGFSLDDSDWMAEALTGLTWALVLTCSMSVTTGSSIDVKTVLWSAIACNTC